MANYEIFQGPELQTKYTCRVLNFLYGPYLKHNFLVHCGEYLQKENGSKCSKDTKRFWRIFPAGGRYSKSSDIISCIFWYMLILYPFIAIGIGSYLRNEVIIINSVILCIIMMYQLLCIYVIIKNTRRFKQFWCITKINLEKYVGLENVIREVDKNNIGDLDLIPTDKRKKMTQKLYELSDTHAVVMLCSRSFWKSCLIDPIICLVTISIIYIIAVLVQLETMNSDILTFNHT